MAGIEWRRPWWVFTWLTWKAWGFWFGLIPTILGTAWLRYLPVAEFQVVVLAGVLQLLGIGMTVYGLHGDAKDFGASIADPFKMWWNVRPWGVRSSTGTARIRFTARGYAIRQTPSGSFTNDVTAEMTRKLDAERVERETAVVGLHGQLKDHVVGSVHLSLVGIYWVLLGTVLSLVKDALEAY